MNKELYYTLTGIYYGYPICCIEDFLINRGLPKKPKELTSNQKHVIDHKGFVPCDKCSILIKDTKDLKSLIKNRICKEEYPNNGSDEEHERFINTIMK